MRICTVPMGVLSLYAVHSSGLYGNTWLYEPHDVPFSYLTLLIGLAADV
jgi:hypothetical protein